MKKISKNLLYLLLIIIIETIVIKAFMYDFLPQKYFYDSNHILSTMKGIAPADKSYKYVADFFNKINIFNFSNIREWGCFISAIFTVILVVFFYNKKKIDKIESIYIIACVALLNIYVYGISKDIIQFIYFFIIYLILRNKKMGNKAKIILTCMVLLYEALNFRVYYAIMAMVFVTIYIIYTFMVKEKSIDKKGLLKIIVIAIIVFFAEVFVVQLLSKENYYSILYARSSVNGVRGNDVDAVTIINDLLGINTNFLKFIGNYCINFFRMLVPIELILKGGKYIPFIIFQIYIGYQILIMSRNLNEKNILWYAVILSFIMVSVIFEPDFGSFIRHESTLVLIMIEAIENNIKYRQNKNIIDRIEEQQ